MPLLAPLSRETASSNPFFGRSFFYTTMSRHRNVKNMIAEDDYDDYDDDYYDDYDDYGDRAPAPAAKPKQTQAKKTTPQAKNTNTPTKSKASAKISVAQPAKTAAASAAGSQVNSRTAGPTFSPTKPVVVERTVSPKPTEMAWEPPPEVPKILLPSAKAKSPLALVMIGHVDAGKSTISGHLLYHAGKTRKSHKAQKPINYAWLLDEDEKERAHGITMDVAVKQLETPKYQIVLQDAPGHSDYVPAMITGTAAADAALLIVDVSDLSSALGGGQLKEHAILARGLGIQQLIVVLNKMDMIGWDQVACKKVVEKMRTFLTVQVGFDGKRTRFIPVSGMTGANINGISKEDAQTASWYKGHTLFEALDGFEAPVKRKTALLEKPLRIILTDVLTEQSKGVGVRGKVLQGWVKAGQPLVVLPTGDETTVIKVNSLQAVAEASIERLKYAVAGEIMDCVVTGVEVTRLSTGSVLSRPNNRPPLASNCLARVWILDTLTIPIIRGGQAIFHLHHLDVPCHLTKLVKTLKKDGSTAKEQPRALTANTQAIVELTLAVPICLEAFQDCRELGRFVLRRSGDSIAVGRIEQVLLS